MALSFLALQIYLKNVKTALFILMYLIIKIEHFFNREKSFFAM
jgi:hypothetical protein